MSAVILRPHSNTNPSNKFRVVNFDRWRKAETVEEAAAQRYLRECDTAEEAEIAARQYNNDEYAQATVERLQT